MRSEKLVRGVQHLLSRFGIFSRVSFKRDPRFNQKGCWHLAISNVGDQVLFEGGQAGGLAFTAVANRVKNSRGFVM